MAMLNFLQGRPGFYWESALHAVLKNGTVGNATDAGSITLAVSFDYDGDSVADDIELILNSTAGDIDVASGIITDGQIDSYSFMINGTTVFTMGGFITPILATVFEQARIDSQPITNPITEDFKAVFLTFMATEPLSITGSGGGDAFFGSSFADLITDVADAEGQFEYYRPGGGVDTIDAGDGFDYLDYSQDGMATGIIANLADQTVVTNDANEDTVDFISGIDGLKGTTEADILIGSSNGDNLNGSGGNDTINGGGGEDFILSGQGDDTIDGGNDFDKLSYHDEEGGFGIVVTHTSGSSGTVTDTYGNDDSFTNVEAIKGSINNDTFNGSGDDEAWEGMKGDDTFTGNGGFDRVEYQNERDQSGSDFGIIVNMQSLDSIDIDLGDGRGEVTVAAGDVQDTFNDTDTLNGISEISGSRHGDHFQGGDNEDNFYGEGGDDVFYGGDSRDELNGDDGDDELNGENGDDVLKGGRGSDEVDGGEGNDYIQGGSSGSDGLENGLDSVSGGLGHDNLSFWDGGGSSTGLDFLFDGANGSGSVGGGTFKDNDWDDADEEEVDTDFDGIERVNGTNSIDAFTVESTFEATNDSNGGPDGARYITVTGGAGDDTFTDNTTHVDNSPTAYGAFRIDYEEEKWAHDDFEGGDWGENGETGVAVNLSSGDIANFLGLGFTLFGGTAIDTFGDTDTFNEILGGTAKVRSFELTNADDFIRAGDLGADIFARSGNDVIEGGLGRDNLDGEGGDDTISGGDGDDYIKGGAGNDDLDGGTGNFFDVLAYEWDRGPSGVDVIWDAGSGNSGTARDAYGDQDVFRNFESIRGTDQRDYFVGNNADNRIEGLGGAVDIFVGGAGLDTWNYDNERWRFRDLNNSNDPINGITVDLEVAVISGQVVGVGTDTFGGLDQYFDVENVIGTFRGDSIRGSSVVNRLEGREGNDSLFGEGGNDFLFGDNDVDVLDGGAGADSLNGGSDVDTATYQSATAGVVAVMETFVGSPAKAGDAAGDTYVSIENLRGSGFNDTLIADGGTNYVEGLAGNDTLNGRAGTDILVGGLGNDTFVISQIVDGNTNDTIQETGLLTGGIDTVAFTGNLAGDSYTLAADLENLLIQGTLNTNGTGNNSNNVLTGNNGINIFSGGNGNDTLNGKLGSDTLTGGAGNDFFDFDTVPNATTNRDLITDMNESGNDTIRLQNTGAGLFLGLTAGTLAAAAYTENTSGLATATTQRIIYETDSGKLWYDSNGSTAGGVIVNFATMDANKQAVMSNLDFFVI